MALGWYIHGYAFFKMNRTVHYRMNFFSITLLFFERGEGVGKGREMPMWETLISCLPIAPQMEMNPHLRHVP